MPFAEREHYSRVGRLVIFNDELNRSAEHATRFVHFFSSELRALNCVATSFSSGSGERSYHADFEGLCGAPETAGGTQHSRYEHSADHPIQHAKFSPTVLFC